MNTDPQLTLAGTESALATRSEPSTVQLLQAVIDRGITAESVGVLKDLMQMRREEITSQNKIAFNRAFFALKKEIGTLELHCDKAARNGNEIMYTYCSEGEILEKLDPLLMKHGFTMLFGQKQDGERLVAEITLIHEEGHEEVRSYAVRQGGTNRAKDATQADTGATTSAWRHLVTKIFGLKSRIKEESDARNEGEYITHEQAQTLREMLTETGGNQAAFFAMAGTDDFEKIRTGSYQVLFNALQLKRRK